MPEVGSWVSDEDERVWRPRRCAQHLRPRVSRAGKGQRRGATLGATHHEQVPRRGKRGQRPGEVFGGAQAQAVVTDRQPANSVTAREQAAGLPARQREELAHDGHGELGRQLHTIAERQGLAAAELPRLDALLRHCQRRGAAHAGVDYELAVRQSGVESKAKSPVCPHSIVSDRRRCKENSAGREFQRTLAPGAQPADHQGWRAARGERAP